jgi:predicted amidohydrolase YtcJ
MASNGITVFRNGSVFDGSKYRAGWELAISGTKVVAVGPSLNITGAVIDLDGGLVGPGFIDAHNHVVQGGLERNRCDLTPVATKADYLRLIAEYATDHAELPWILGGGWAMPAFPGGTPLAADLDVVVPDRPVYLPNKDHHGVWVNSRALELAGIDRRTPDPVDGYFERDTDGNPTGTVHEGAAAAFAQVLPKTGFDECYAGLITGQKYLHSVGVTGWQDAILGPFMGTPDISEIYRVAAERGDLSAYVVGALWWDRERGLEQVSELRQRREQFTVGRLRASSVKIMQDGVAENFTAAMTTPYLDRCGHATTNRGHSFVDAQMLREVVMTLSQQDFQVHVHAIGDRGVREALDAFAHARKTVAGDHDLRHHIAHLQVIEPTDIARFAELSVTANMQALWACWDDQMVDLTVPFLGEERSLWQYPFGDLYRSGAALAAGSDWPVSSPDPMAAIHVAVNRMEYGGSGRVGSEPFLPQQALPLEIAMSAYTSGSARINHRDQVVGYLRPGYLADLVVLDRDPFAGDLGEVGAAQTRQTWIEGRLVYSRHSPI